MASKEARELAAQAWCTEETSSIEMDVRLAEAFADILDKYLLNSKPMQDAKK
jgi:hypothetical protein